MMIVWPTLILAVFYVYLGLRLVHGTLAWLVLALPFVLVWLLPAVFWSLQNDPPDWIRVPYQWACFISMGLISYLLVLTIARDVIFGPALLVGAQWARVPFEGMASVVILALSVLTVGIGMGRALGTPDIRKVDIPIDGLPSELEGFRIVQLTDLHIGSTMGRSFVKRVVARTNELQSDLVVLTGDIGDGDPARLRERTAPLRGLSAPSGVLYVLGNHECYWNATRWVEEMRSLGAKVLINSNVSLERGDAKLLVGGVTDPVIQRAGEVGIRPDPGRAAAAAGEAGENRAGAASTVAFKILLAHNPQIAPEAEKAGFGLLLAGHTHGGQFFPWTLVARHVHRYLKGLNREGRMWVYVNPGTGTWGPPIRIGTTPEITLIRLVRHHSSPEVEQVQK